MISILLMILKIIGILLLSVLGLLLLIILLVLFVPFRYDVKGNVRIPPEDTGQEQVVDVKARVHWLLQLVQVQVFFSKADGLKKKLRIFFIPFSLDKEKSAEQENEALTVEADQAVTGEATSGELSETTEGTDATEIVPDITVAVIEDSGVGEASQIDAEQDSATVESEETKAEEKVGLVQKIKNKIGALKAKVLELKDMASCMLELFARKKGLAVAYIKKENTQLAIKAVLLALWGILKHIFPRKYQGDVTFGSGDPEMTGKIFAVAAVFYPVYEPKLALYPDMEQKIVDANGSLSGRIRLWNIVFPVLKLVLNKNLRRVLKEAMLVKDEMMKTPDEIKEITNKAA